MNKTACYFIFIMLLFSLTVTAQSIESLKAELQNSKHDTSKIEILNKIGYQYLKSSPALALEYANKALNLAVKYADEYEMLNSYLLLGLANKTYGKYDIAAQNYFNALRIAEKLNLKNEQSVCQNNIGSMYQTQNNFAKALEYFKKSLEIEKLLNNKSQVSIRLYNIGVVYEDMDSLDLAYTYYFNSLLIEQELKNKEGEFFALYGISGIETKKGSYDKALSSINNALIIAKETNDKNNISLCFSGLGDLYKTIKDYAKAIAYYDSSVVYAAQVMQRNTVRLGYKELSDIYFLQGNYKEAYNYLRLYTNINDTINNAEINNKVAEMEAQFEMEKTESQLLYLKKTADLFEQNSISEKRNKYFLLITFLLSIILAVSNLRRILPDTKNIILFSIIVFVLLMLITFILILSGVYTYDFSPYYFFTAFVDVLTIATLPIFVFVLLAERLLMSKNLKTAQSLSQQIREYKMPDNEVVLSFKFENEKNKFEVLMKNLICIEANDNYSAFYYYVDNKIKKDLFRATLKSVEEQLEHNEEVIRCHKSFIVNLRHIKRITGNAQGYKLYLAELNFEIPVSRNFPKEILQKIRSNI